MRSLEATRSEVMAVPAPQFTDTWHPVSHAEVLRAVFAGIEYNGMNISRDHHSMTQNGNNLFSVFTLADMTQDGTEFQIGLRNSINKQMAIGITIGYNIMVCSNMIFSGEYITFRKHTGGLSLDELNYMVAMAIMKAELKLTTEHNRQQSMKEITPSNRAMKLMTYDAMVNGGLTPSKFNTFLEAYDAEARLNGDTLFSWLGAGTRTCRGDSLISIARKTPRLTAIADEYMMQNAA